jgi:hypothetical protein
MLGGAETALYKKKTQENTSRFTKYLFLIRHKAKAQKIKIKMSLAPRQIYFSSAGLLSQSGDGEIGMSIIPLGGWGVSSGICFKHKTWAY